MVPSEVELVIAPCRRCGDPAARHHVDRARGRMRTPCYECRRRRAREREEERRALIETLAPKPLPPTPAAGFIAWCRSCRRTVRALAPLPRDLERCDDCRRARANERSRASRARARQDPERLARDRDASRLRARASRYRRRQLVRVAEEQAHAAAFVARVTELRVEGGASIRAIARQLRISRGRVQRLLAAASSPA